MKILSFDSATESATCALIEDEKLLGEITFNYKKQHSVLIMTMIDTLLHNSNTDITEVDGFIISKGPGSFTGLRIGMATFKGICNGLNKPLLGISSLDALAYNLAYTDGIICPILDALRGNVYTAIYRFDKNTLLKLEDYSAMAVEDLIEKLKQYNSKVTFIGDGVYKHRETISKNLPLSCFAPTHLNVVKASSLGELGYNLLKEGSAENIYTLAPLYIRKPQAEREYEEKYHKGIED